MPELRYRSNAETVAARIAYGDLAGVSLENKQVDS